MTFSYKQALEYLQLLESRGSQLGLERIKKAAKKAGNPQSSYEIIHVAGTNGKGSVSAMISAIIYEAGHTVGMLTSPHLMKVTERIRVNERDISENDFALLVEKTKKITDKLTYFEFLTLMALIYFKDKKVDYVILETGLGGRLDATNIISRSLAVITSISIDHVKYLGNTIEQIAQEKAGIIKKNAAVITQEYGKAWQVIKKYAKKQNARIIYAEKATLRSNLGGKFQKKNIALAVQVAKELKINKSAIRKGLNKVKWQGRFQFLEDNLLVDCAHNPDSAKALARELKRIPAKKILIIGFLEDKDYKKILKELLPIATKVIIVKAKSDRALDPEIIAEEVKRHGKKFEVIPDIRNAVKAALKISKFKKLVVIAGSIYVVGEVLKFKGPNKLEN